MKSDWDKKKNLPFWWPHFFDPLLSDFYGLLTWSWLTSSSWQGALGPRELHGSGTLSWRDPESLPHAGTTTRLGRGPCKLGSLKLRVLQWHMSCLKFVLYNIIHNIYIYMYYIYTIYILYIYTIYILYIYYIYTIYILYIYSIYILYIYYIYIYTIYILYIYILYIYTIYIYYIYIHFIDIDTYIFYRYMIQVRYTYTCSSKCKVPIHIPETQAVHTLLKRLLRSIRPDHRVAIHTRFLSHSHIYISFDDIWYTCVYIVCIYIYIFIYKRIIIPLYA